MKDHFISIRMNIAIRYSPFRMPTCIIDLYLIGPMHKAMGYGNYWKIYFDGAFLRNELSDCFIVDSEQKNVGPSRQYPKQ